MRNSFIQSHLYFNLSKRPMERLLLSCRDSGLSYCLEYYVCSLCTVLNVVANNDLYFSIYTRQLKHFYSKMTISAYFATLGLPTANLSPLPSFTFQEYTNSKYCCQILYFTVLWLFYVYMCIDKYFAQRALNKVTTQVDLSLSCLFTFDFYCTSEYKYM